VRARDASLHDSDGNVTSPNAIRNAIRHRPGRRPARSIGGDVDGGHDPPFLEGRRRRPAQDTSPPIPRPPRCFVERRRSRAGVHVHAKLSPPLSSASTNARVRRVSSLLHHARCDTSMLLRVIFAVRQSRRHPTLPPLFVPAAMGFADARGNASSCASSSTSVTSALGHLRLHQTLSRPSPI